MTTVSIDIQPKEILFRIIVSSDPIDPDEEKRCKRFISIEGTPNYGGTYRYMDIQIVQEGVEIPLPDAANMTIYCSEDIKTATGTVTYLDSYSDDELGLSEPAHLNIEIQVSQERFNDLWDLSRTADNRKIATGVTFRAPKTDISGHVITWELTPKNRNSLSMVDIVDFWFDVRLPNRTQET